MSQWPTNFKSAFCRAFGCRPEDYEPAVFRRALFRHALPFAWWLRWRDPEFFREDLDFIHEVGGLTDPDLFRQEVNYFYGRNLRDRGWLRTLLRIRVSGKRLMRLRRRLFPEP